MRNLKKLLAVVVAVCVLATMAIPAFAAETTLTEAEICAGLGILKGDGAGVTDTYLAKGTERLQAATLYLRLLGLEDEALAFDGEENFEDADLVYAGGQRILAYLKANPDLGWSGVNLSKTMFDPTGEASAQMIYKVLLEALGYKQDVDFEWADTISFAADKGLSKIADVDELTNNDLAIALVEGLKATMKDGSKTLLDKLIEDGIIDEADAIAVGLKEAAPEALEVVSVTAINAKQVSVVFNKDMNKDTLTATNFEIYDNGSTKLAATPALQSDNKTVILTIDGNNKLTNASTAKVVVKKDVKAADDTALSADYTNDSVTVQDTVMPAIEKIETAGLKTLKIYFTEPVWDGVDDDIATNQITIKSGIYTYVVTGIKANYAEKSLTVTVGTNLIEGNLEITVNAQGMADSGAIRDFAGLVALKTVTNYTFAPDNTVATVTLDSVNKATKTAKVKFSKMVYGNGVKLYHSVSGSDAYGTAAVTKTIDNAATEWEFVFTNDLPSGTLTFYLVNDPNNASNQLTDLYGVKVPNQTFTYTVVADTTPPTVSEVKVNTNTSFDIVFSEEVNATEAAKADNYEILKADGSKVSFSVSIVDTKTVRLSAALEDSATYTINVKAMKDVAGNAMESAYSVQKTIGDNTAPTVSDKYLVGSDTIYIVYSEAMNESDIGNKANYLVAKSDAVPAYATLGDNDTVTVVSNKKVKITIKDGGLVAGETDVKIGPVKDLAGKRLYGDATFQTEISNIPASTLGIDGAQLIAKNKIKVIFNKEIGAFDPGEIAIRKTDGSATTTTYRFQSVESNTVNSDGKTEIVIVLDNDVAYNAKDTTITGDAIEVYSVGTPANTKSLEGTVLAAGQRATIDDKLAPAVDKIVFVDATTIKVKFKEELKAGTFAAVGKNGFSVAGGTLNGAAIDGTDNTIVILSGTDFTVNTDVSYNGTNGITDANNNALEAFTHSDTLATSF